jgi:hypothetical protein
MFDRMVNRLGSSLHAQRSADLRLQRLIRRDEPFSVYQDTTRSRAQIWVADENESV